MSESRELRIAEYLVPGSSTIYYIPNFVSQSEEEYLLRKIQDTPRQSWKGLNNRRLMLLGGVLSSSNVLISQPMPDWIAKQPPIIERLRGTNMFEGSPHLAPNHIILNEYQPGQGIMAHQDGPAYHPVVATISLGSHTVFHYYEYKASEEDVVETRGGRVIDKTPTFSVFLEPRSVVITTRTFYSDRLHGIDEVAEDVVNTEDGVAYVESTSTNSEDGMPTSVKTRLANTHLLGDENLRLSIQKGCRLVRQTRYSLTCRDVARVVKTAFGKR